MVHCYKIKLSLWCLLLHTLNIPVMTQLPMIVVRSSISSWKFSQHIFFIALQSQASGRVS